MKSVLHGEFIAEGADRPPAYEDLVALLTEALDLVPRTSVDDPMAPALADWCRTVRATVRDAERAAVREESAT